MEEYGLRKFVHCLSLCVGPYCDPEQNKPHNVPHASFHFYTGDIYCATPALSKVLRLLQLAFDIVQSNLSIQFYLYGLKALYIMYIT